MVVRAGVTRTSPAGSTWHEIPDMSGFCAVYTSTGRVWAVGDGVARKLVMRVGFSSRFK
jgi:hypothetical protein